MSTVTIQSEIAGKVWQIMCRPGQSVNADQPLLILECMKMEVPVPCPADGEISAVLVNEGDEVEEAQDLVILTTDPS